MGGGGDEVGDWNGAVVDAGGDESGVVGHIDHEECVDGAGDFGEAGVVNFAWVCTGSGDDHAWFVLLCELADLIEVDPVVCLADAVVDGFVEFSAEVEVHAVGEVSTVSEVHGEDGAAGFEHGHVDGHIGL